MRVVAVSTAAGLAALRPDVLTTEERAAAGAIQQRGIRADIRFLASDLLEGRGPDTRGDRLAQAYVASRFEAMGLEPGAPNGTWFQPFELVSVETRCPDVLSVTRGEEEGWICASTRTSSRSRASRRMCRARRRRDRIRGLRDRGAGVRLGRLQGGGPPGKVLLFMNNDPEGDPDLFEGRRRLYYGRWDYKLEMAARQGAAGHHHPHDPVGRYGWPVVQSS